MRLFCVLLALTLVSPFLSAQDQLPRTIVTTDGEIDDVDSFVRLLLYANEMKLEGLVYSSSMWHYKGDGQGTTMVSDMEMTRDMYGERTDLRWPGEEWIQEIIRDYAAVYETLQRHAEGYPHPDSLLQMVKVGNITFEGEMDNDTEGSDHIKTVLLDADTSSIYLQVWGGTNTIARALKSIQDTYADSPEWEDIYRRVCDKAIIYAVMDQDATYRDYIAVSWPDIPVLYNTGQFWSLAYDWKRAVPQKLHYWLEGRFMGNHIIQDHGPLTANYYSYGDGQQQAGDPEHIHGDSTRLDSAQWGSFKPYDFISEGDSPAYLHLVNVGLHSLKTPEWGGWGGRLVPTDTTGLLYEDGGAAADYNPFTRKRDNAYALTRWIPALQRDFAARADWCVLPYESANHPPEVNAEGEVTRAVKPGDWVTLQVSATDPDGDDLFYHWFQYGEVDTYAKKAMMILNKSEVRVKVPRDMTSGQTLHLIAEVTDGGSPSLTRYARMVLVAE
ncbi:MAG: nucleoside hydrolase-like domain-containing protein [Lewinella sp.]